MVFYTNRFIPKRFAGRTIGPLIFIRPKYKNDKGLLAHEKVHVGLFWITLGLILPLRLLIRPLRYWAELRAYRVQLRLVPTLLKHTVAAKFAGFLANNYGLRVSASDALRDLLK